MGELKGVSPPKELETVDMAIPPEFSSRSTKKIGLQILKSQ